MIAVRDTTPLLFLLLWSSGNIVVKIGLQSASAWSFLLLRSMLALIILAALFFASSRQRRVALPPWPCWTTIGAGLLMQGGYQGCVFFAQERGLAPGLLAIILGLQPIMMPLFAGDAISRRLVYISTIGFSGLVVTVSASQATGAIDAIGASAALAAMFAVSVGTIMQRRAALDPLTAAGWHAALGCVLFGGIVLAVGWRADVDLRLAASVVWMAGAVSVGAVFLLFRMLTRQSAANVGMLFYLVPPLTIAMDYLAFGTALAPLALVGGAIVVVAMVLQRRDQAKEGPH